MYVHFTDAHILFHKKAAAGYIAVKLKEALCYFLFLAEISHLTLGQAFKFSVPVFPHL